MNKKKVQEKKYIKRGLDRRKSRKENIVGNFRGFEDIFWTKIVKGFKNLLTSPFK